MFQIIHNPSLKSFSESKSFKETYQVLCSSCNFMRPTRNIPLIVLFAFTGLISMISCPSFSQEQSSPIASPQHRKILQEYKTKADEFCAKNLNRFGLYQLQNYDQALDTFVAREKADTLAAIQKNYTVRNIERKDLTDSLKIQATKLTQSKDSYQKKYHSLLRKAGIAFIIWLSIVLVVLKWRNRSVRKAQTALDSNIVQLRSSEAAFSEGENLLKAANAWEEKNAALTPLAVDIQKTILSLKEKLPSDAVQGNAYKTLAKNADTMVSSSNRLKNFATIIRAQYTEPVAEKQPANMNLLCDQYADLAYAYMQQEDGSFICQFSKDFEKNLPAINVTADAVGSLLLFVLSNAFNAVAEKQKREIKGYIPKVSISTRILPRFVQVRIKDNGDGITDEIMNQMYQPFYSARPAGEGAGLGLFFSEQIMKDNQGEIKIESEKGNGTDVYLKFFLKA